MVLCKAFALFLNKSELPARLSVRKGKKHFSGLQGVYTLVLVSYRTKKLLSIMGIPYLNEY